MIFQTLIYIFLIYLWLRRKSYFPIQERSPYLVLQSLITCFISCLIIPTSILISEISGIIWINPFSYIEKEKKFRLTLLLRSFEVVMNSFIILPYIMRNIRIYIVFNPKINSNILKYFFSKESRLIVVI